MIIQSTAQVWKQFEFWCEGVIFSSLGLFGLVSNLASIITFLSPEVFVFSKNLIFLVIWLSRVQITPKTDLRRSKNVISVPWGAPPDTLRCSALRYPVPCHEVSAAAPWGTLWHCPLRYSVLIFRPSPGQFQGWAKELYPTSDFWWRIPRYHHHFPLPDIFSSLQGTVVIFGNLSQMRRQTFNQLLAALAVCDIL